MRYAVCLVLALVLTVTDGRAQTETRTTPSDDTGSSPSNAVADTADARLVSPYGTVLRSLIIPGWGQVHIRERVEGFGFLAGVGGLTAAWAMTYRDFRQQYNDVYLPVVTKHGVSSPEANAVYADVNRRFKTSRFLLFTTVGMWGYSLIDAYVDSNIYNAEVRAEDVIKETAEIRRLQFGWQRGAPYLRYRITY